jgi:hypothetical protein
MSILHFFAQASSYTYTESSSSLDESTAAALGAFILMIYGIAFIFGIAIYIVTSLCLMKIFAKAGVKPWIAWVPFYNNWKMLEIGGQQGFWSVLTIVPVVSLVSAIYLFIAQYHIGKKLGKGGEFVLFAIFLAPVWYIWLALDKSPWNDAASTAPSLHRG